MKAYRGLLTAYNPDTKKMHPFFLRVRSEDIISSNPIQIDSALKETSTRWKLERFEDDVDVSYYRFIANWSTRNDSNAETVSSDYSDSEIAYYLWKDGRMDIEGTIRVSSYDGKDLEDAIDNNFHGLPYKIWLPFAMQENDIFQTTFALGDCYGVTTYSYLESDTIKNQKLNPHGNDKDKYLYGLNLFAVVPKDTDTSIFEKMRKAAEVDSYRNLKHDEYMKQRFPFHISYRGYWRSAVDGEVQNPTSINDEYAGWWAVEKQTPMRPTTSTTSSIIRNLEVGVKVRNYGYYAKSGDKVYLFVTLTATNQVGYVDMTNLKKDS